MTEKREGEWAIAVTEDNKWVIFADLKYDSIANVLNEAKKYSKEHDVEVLVYEADIEHIIRE